MAAKALSSSLVTLLIFAIILSPMSICHAVRFTQRGIYINNSSPMFIYIYIYICVCVCVCVTLTNRDKILSLIFIFVLLAASGPICPACVCCTPAPPGSCCQCCATPVETQSENGSPWYYLHISRLHESQISKIKVVYTMVTKFQCFIML